MPAGLSKQTIRNYCKWHGIGYFDDDRHGYVVFPSRLRALLME